MLFSQSGLGTVSSFSISTESSGWPDVGGAGHIRLSIICAAVLLDRGGSMKHVRTVRERVVAEWSKFSS